MIEAMKMKRSAGILVYKKDKDLYQVFLAHMGGPYWQNINIGAWSIPKGEYKKGEKAIECAKREFEEETGLQITSDLQFLGSKKVSHKKLVTIFTCSQELDNSKFKSNFFEKEFPPGSHNIQKFPEMDKAEWIPLEEAKKIILPNQLPFLLKLERQKK